MKFLISEKILNRVKGFLLCKQEGFDFYFSSSVLVLRTELDLPTGRIPVLTEVEEIILEKRSGKIWMNLIFSRIPKIEKVGDGWAGLGAELVNSVSSLFCLGDFQFFLKKKLEKSVWIENCMMVDVSERFSGFWIKWIPDGFGLSAKPETRGLGIVLI